MAFLALIRAPIAGTILRKHVRAGKSLGERGEQPIVTIGDASVLCVPVEIEEADVARVRVGQVAHVTADADGGRQFTGRIVRVGTLVEKKNVRTERRLKL